MLGPTALQTLIVLLKLQASGHGDPEEAALQRLVGASRRSFKKALEDLELMQVVSWERGGSVMLLGTIDHAELLPFQRLHWQSLN